jgi:hypothetical protein
MRGEAPVLKKICQVEELVNETTRLKYFTGIADRTRYLLVREGDGWALLVGEIPPITPGIFEDDEYLGD